MAEPGAPGTRGPRRVLVACIHLEGHMGAILNICNVLAARGHSITVASTEDARGMVAKRAPGAAFVGAPEPFDEEAKKRLGLGDFDQNKTPWGAVRCMATLFAAHGYAIAGALFEALDSGKLARPDVLLVDFITMGGFDVAERYNIPYVVVATAPLGVALQWANKHQYLAPSDIPYEGFGGPWAVMPAAMSPVQRWVTNPLLKRLGPLPTHWWATPVQNQYRARVGLPPVRTFMERKEGEGAPRSMQLVGVSWEQEVRLQLPPTWHLVGPLGHDFSQPAPELQDAELEAWLSAAQAAGRPVVYIAMGTVVLLSEAYVQLLAAMAEALGDGVAVVWSLKEDRQRYLPQGPSRLPEARLLVRSWLPQVALLGYPAVRAFVSHGGQNSTNEALACGKPVLALPFGADQFINAQHVVNKGLGLEAVPSAATAPQLAGLVCRLLDEPAFAQAAEALGRRMRGTSGPRNAVTAIEQFMQGQQVVLLDDDGGCC